MRVLMVTMAVDEHDSVLGFVPSWINNIAQRVEKVNVFTPIYNEASHLLENVRVYSLDKKASKLGKFLYFNQIMFRLLLKETDVMFCHMSPYLASRTAPYARLFGVPVVWFRAHGSVNLDVRVAHFFTTRIATSSEMGFRIKSNKVVVIGQGIDVGRFKPGIGPSQRRCRTVLSVGRISPIKDYETLIRATNVLVNEKEIRDLEFVIVAQVYPSEQGYYEGVRKLVRELNLEGHVKFTGAVPYGQIVPYYQGCDIFVNPSLAGSLEKTVLEAMACARPAITSNEAYYPVFDDEMRKKCFFAKGDYRELANKIEWFLANSEEKLASRLREIVVKGHSIDSLADNLVKIFEEVIH